jgi:hypothetical protein
MDYREAREAFFAPRDGAIAQLGWASPARRLRDAIEPLATVSFWSEPAYDAYAALGLDFLTGYVFSRASVLGEPDPAVVASAFGVFDPDAVAALYTAGREACSLADVRAARLDGATAALHGALGDLEESSELADTVAALRSALESAPALGRPLFAGLAALPWPENLLARLWHACSMLREHRGDAHLAALVVAGLDGLQANLLTELWVGWEPQSYASTRAWSPEAMSAAAGALGTRGLSSDGALTDDGRVLREDVERATDAAEASLLAVLGPELDDLIERLDGWSQRVVDLGWFPPDPLKRASG